MNIILAVSLNLVNGFTGQFSLGHAGFMAVGAYGSAKLTLVFAGAAAGLAAGRACWWRSCGRPPPPGSAGGGPAERCACAATTWPS